MCKEEWWNWEAKLAKLKVSQKIQKKVIKCKGERKFRVPNSGPDLDLADLDPQPI